MFLKTSMLLLSIVAYMAASPMSYNMVLNVTVAVLDHYHSSCVYFLQSNPKQSTNKYSYVHKIKSLAAMRKITIAVISGESLATTLDEQRCFPLYVIFSANGVLWNYFKQESIINRMSNAKWVLFLDKKTPLEYIFAEIYIPPNCEFLVAENGSVVSLIEVYNVNRTLPLQIQHTGNWSLSNGASWTTIPFHERRGDLQGIILQSGVNSYEVIESIYACEDRTAIKFCGEIQEIWHILEEVMNFTTNYTVPDDQSYGSRNKEGKWNGIMNLTADNKVEVGVGRFIFTDERMSVVSLLPPILISTMSVFIQESDLDDITWEYVLAPLSSDLWLTIIATMIILTLFLSITWFLGDRYGSHPEVEKYNICNSWISVFASFCQQGHDTTPYSWSCRLVFFTSYLTGVIVLVAYSATFISFLTVKKAVLPFTDFKGLLQDGTYKLGVLPNSAQMNYLQPPPPMPLPLPPPPPPPPLPPQPPPHPKHIHTQ
ncbi:glutamate receptor ionotropic, kainate 3-like [Periplaneta americana]|uniref:glutamate receptor ionotropic, kainate 3-like n=1 Tax=Periplaneta americana TaxID=6978 RepID=UPI0037E86A57